MIKREELSNPNSCINKAADDEPVFVLRGHDLLAPAVVRTWAKEFKNIHQTAQFGGFDAAAQRPAPIFQWDSDKSKRKYEEAMKLADAMDEWTNKRLPD